MQEELVKRWIEALRSRKYKQGKTYLHNVKENTYCCLGVLCELTDVKKNPSIDNGISYYQFVDQKFASFPATGIIASWGIAYYSASKLAEMNDRGNDFRTIANKIEEMHKNGTL